MTTKVSQELAAGRVGPPALPPRRRRAPDGEPRARPRCVFIPGAYRPSRHGRSRCPRARREDEVVVADRAAVAERTYGRRGRWRSPPPASPRCSGPAERLSGSARRCRWGPARQSPPGRAAAGRDGGCGRSTTVTRTSSRRPRSLAASRPAKPAPTITTRGRRSGSIAVPAVANQGCEVNARSSSDGTERLASLPRATRAWRCGPSSGFPSALAFCGYPQRAIRLAAAASLGSTGLRGCSGSPGAELRVEGSPAALADRPAIYVMNHQSSLDIPAAFAVLPVDLRFIAKHTLRKVPFLGWYMCLDRDGLRRPHRNSTQAVGTLAARRASGSGAASRCSPTPRGRAPRREHPPASRRGRSCSPCRPACPSCRWRSRARSGACPRTSSRSGRAGADGGGHAHRHGRAGGWSPRRRSCTRVREAVHRPAHLLAKPAGGTRTLRPAPCSTGRGHRPLSPAGHCGRARPGRGRPLLEPSRPATRPTLLACDGTSGRPEERRGQVSEKLKAVAAAVAAIEKQFGKGAIMQLGRTGRSPPVPIIPIGLGRPRPRARRGRLSARPGRGDLRPRVVRQDHAHAARHRRRCRRGRRGAFIDAEHALDVAYARKLGRPHRGPAGQPARHRRAGAGDHRAAGPQRGGRSDGDRLGGRAGARGRRSRGRWATRTWACRPG